MRKQRGFSLILLLTVLMAIGGFSMAGLSTALRSSHSLSSAVSSNAELAQARQALISYAAHYPYLYGAQGAGAGHLPCPDRDSLDTDAIGWSIDQGPSPPCGSTSVARGHLPSHISFSNGRYMIHAGLGLRVDYSVSSHVINNPSRHAVNPTLISSLSLELPTVAVLQQRVPVSGSGAIQTTEVMISNAALALTIRPSVAAWFIGKNRSQGAACLLHATAAQQEEISETDQRCAQLRQLLLTCRAADLSIEQSSLTSSQFSLLMLYLADDIPVDYQCAQSALEQTTIDNVPAKKHWFIRNNWLEWISIDHDSHCAELAEAPCTLTYVNSRAYTSIPEPLLFRWVLGV